MKDNIEYLLDSLSKSKFRGSFHLNKKMKDYVKEKGMDKIKLDAKELITKRIAPETSASCIHCTTCNPDAVAEDA